MNLGNSGDVVTEQKLEINSELLSGLKSVLGTAPGEATRVVVLAAYLHHLAKEFGLTESTSVDNAHIQPPAAIATWLSDVLEGDLGYEFLRDRLYGVFVDIARDSSSRRLVNRRDPLSEVGLLKLAQVHWNIQWSESRPLLPIPAGQPLPGKGNRTAAIVATRKKVDFATERLSSRAAIGVDGLGEVGPLSSSSGGFRTLGARIAVVAARKILEHSASTTPLSAGELRIRHSENGVPRAAIWWGAGALQLAETSSALTSGPVDFAESIRSRLDAHFFASEWPEARPLSDFMIGHLEERSSVDAGASDRALAVEYFRRWAMFKGRGHDDDARNAGRKAAEIFEALLDVEIDNSDPELVTGFLIGSASEALDQAKRGQLLQGWKTWEGLLERGYGGAIAEQPNGYVLLLTAAEAAVAVARDLEREPEPGDPEIRSRVDHGELDSLRDEIDDFLDRVTEVIKRAPASGDLSAALSPLREVAELAETDATERFITDMTRYERNAALVALLASRGDVRLARTGDTEAHLALLRTLSEVSAGLRPFFGLFLHFLAAILRGIRSQVALLLVESDRVDEAIAEATLGVGVLGTKNVFDAADVKELVDYVGIALMSSRPELVLDWVDLVDQRRDDDSEGDASNLFAPAFAEVFACRALVWLDRTPDGINRLERAIELQDHLLASRPPLERRFYQLPLTPASLRELADSVSAEGSDVASEAMLLLAHRLEASQK
jgi:hypothetical protein